LTHRLEEKKEAQHPLDCFIMAKIFFFFGNKKGDALEHLLFVQRLADLEQAGTTLTAAVFKVLLQAQMDAIAMGTDLLGTERPLPSHDPRARQQAT
jgi:hypothetical protein